MAYNESMIWFCFLKANGSVLKGKCKSNLWVHSRYLFQVNTEVCSNALVQLSIFLCHRHTYVRRSTSTRFYESLLIYGDNSSVPVENLDAVMNLLSSTNWEEPVDVVKPVRNELCSLMGVRIPIVKKKNVA